MPEIMLFTSDAFGYGIDGGYRYSGSATSPTTGEYFYRGGPYYITVMGGDNTEYTLYNRVNSYGDLPVNHEFQFENYMGATTTHAYTLDIDEPSMLRMNTTATGAELDVRLTGVYEDGYRVARTISFESDMQSSSEYYLPIGEYFVEMIVDDGVNEWAEFNLGPIVTDTQTTIVDVGGLFLDVETFHMYNLTVFLNNEDNVTVWLEVAIYDPSGWALYSTGMTLANRWDGSQILPHPSIWYNDTISYPYQGWSEGQAFVAFCAYAVNNNTAGATNGYTDYPVDLTIQWENMDDQYYAGFESLDISTGAASTNITLLSPPTPMENWGVMLNTTPGVWYNVSVKTGGLNNIGNGLFSLYAGMGHWTGSGDLDDTYVGSLSEFSFQFGAISDTLQLDFYTQRNPVEGFIWIEITPMETHQLEVQQITPLGPDIFSILGSVAVPAVIGVAVIVVVYIVYVKRYKT
jgi:hypothetical protein